MKKLTILLAGVLASASVLAQTAAAPESSREERGTTFKPVRGYGARSSLWALDRAVPPPLVRLEVRATQCAGDRTAATSRCRAR